MRIYIMMLSEFTSGVSVMSFADKEKQPVFVVQEILFELIIITLPNKGVICVYVFQISIFARVYFVDDWFFFFFLSIHATWIKVTGIFNEVFSI